MNLRDLIEKNSETIDQILEDQKLFVKKYTIPKKNGKHRLIIEPIDVYKDILKSISVWLRKSYKIHNASHGFRIARGIVSNANPHVGSHSVGTIDIKDFFDSIKHKHLVMSLSGNTRICRGCPNFVCEGQTRCKPTLYINSNEFACNEIVKIVKPEFDFDGALDKVIKLCLYEGSTPQGFPTSPVLANIVMRDFDKKVTKWCEDREIRYTRYADDLAFSHGSKSEGGMPGYELGDTVVPKVKAMLWGYGFAINERKLRFKHQGSRLELCGVTVNDKLTLSKYQVKMFRAMVHHACVKKPKELSYERLMQLRGWASYYYSVNPEKAEPYVAMLKAAKPAF